MAGTRDAREARDELPDFLSAASENELSDSNICIRCKTPAKKRHARELWRRAARMAREQLFATDPLQHVELGEPEHVVRRRWINDRWVEDIAEIRTVSYTHLTLPTT